MHQKVKSDSFCRICKVILKYNNNAFCLSMSLIFSHFYYISESFNVARFLGLKLPPIIEQVAWNKSSLLFTNCKNITTIYKDNKNKKNLQKLLKSKTGRLGL